MKTLAIDSNADSIVPAQEQQFNIGIKREERDSLRWGWVILLPGFVLLAMTLLGFTVIGHTLYTEAQSDHLIADTDRFVTEKTATSAKIGVE